jgi:hypothetical protein
MTLKPDIHKSKIINSVILGIFVSAREYYSGESGYGN